MASLPPMNMPSQLLELTAEVSHLQNDLARLNQLNQTLQDENEALGKKLAREQKAYEKLQAQFVQHAHLIGILERQVAGLKMQLSATEDLVEVRKERIDELHEEIVCLKGKP